MDGLAIIAGSEAPEVFELVEAALDALSGFVGVVVGDDRPTRKVGLNDGHNSGGSDGLTKGVAVVGHVSDHASGFALATAAWLPCVWLAFTMTSRAGEGVAKVLIRPPRQRSRAPSWRPFPVTVCC